MQAHFSGMEIDSAVVFVRLGVESHEASFGDGFRQSRAYPNGVRSRAALHSIHTPHRVEHTAVFFKNFL
jgi:hypothetical protein